MSLGATSSASDGAQQTGVTCPAARRLIGGGFSWRDDEPNSIISCAPSDTDPLQTWTVRGLVHSGGNTLFAWANCLEV